MSRYIDADALNGAVQDFPYGYRGMIRQLIAEQPTVDVVQVVHCKDCKYWNKVDELDRVQYGECHKGFRLATFLSENFFCADGVRKTE